MEITAIEIEYSTRHDAKVLATAQVTLNYSLSLRGIKILKGRYGLFLAFPGITSESPQRAFDTLSMQFRKELQTEVLGAYKKQLTAPLALLV